MKRHEAYMQASLNQTKILERMAAGMELMFDSYRTKPTLN
jgi:hypothetical protein